MLKRTQVQRLMFLFAIAGLFAVAADFACLEDVCAENQQAQFSSAQVIDQHRVLRLADALARSRITLTDAQQTRLARQGQLFGLVPLDRPVKHPDGAIEMQPGYLPQIPAGHPWGTRLTPADDAFYSFVEERIIKPNLYDPDNPEHAAAIKAYLDKAHSGSPKFVGWTYAGSKTECPRKMGDAPGTMAPGDAGP
jgi:hypothetical protein